MKNYLLRRAAFVGLMAALALAFQGVSLAEEKKPAKGVRNLAPSAGEKSLEGLLKEIKIPYERKGDLFLIAVQMQTEPGKYEGSLAIARQLGVGPDGRFPIVHLYSILAPMPENFKAPLAMLKRVEELNSTLITGKLVVDQSQRAVYYKSDFWLRTADPQILTGHLLIGHLMYRELGKELAPYFKE